MAELEDKYEDNVMGLYFVDEQCIDCDLAEKLLQPISKRNEDGGYSYVYKQHPRPKKRKLYAQRHLRVV